MQRLGKDDLIAIAHGATFLGSGGGGTLSSTLEMIHRWFPEDRKVRLLDVGEAAADKASLTAVVTFIGSPAANRDLTDLSPAIQATELMDRCLRRRQGKPLGRTMAVELGVQSSAVVHLMVASALGLDAVDGDGVGRAVPRLAATVFAGAELATGPAVLASGGPGHLLVEDATPNMVQEIATAVLARPPFGGVAGLALWPMGDDALQRALPPDGGTRGTISLAAQIGRILMQRPPNTVTRVVSCLRRHGLRAEVVFRGELREVHTKTSADHLALDLVDVHGGDDDTATIYASSENMVFWQGDRPQVVAPDSICCLTAEGRPFSNTELPPVGTELAVLAVEARPVLRRYPALVEVFHHMTRDVGYPGRYAEFS